MRGRDGRRSERPESAISRVLSRAIIHLRRLSPAACSNLPGSPLGTGGGTANRPVLPYLVLLRAGFTVPRAVTSRAVRSYRTFSPLPDPTARRYIFCGTFHGLAPPRGYLALCPKEPGLSSVDLTIYRDCQADSGISVRGIVHLPAGDEAPMRPDSRDFRD